MKKALLAAVSTFALIFGSTAVVSPASALVWPNVGQTITMTVGDVVSLDMGCQEDNIVNVSFDSGTLPTGLSIDSAGLVTGTPTTQGDFRLDGYYCSYNGGASDVSSPMYFVIFQVNAPVTRAPFAEALNLNTDDCMFYGAVLFPQAPDDATAFIEISNQAGTSLRSNTPGGFYLESGRMYSQILSIQDLNDGVHYFRIDSPTTKTGTEPFRCGELLTLKVGYQSGGAPAATFETDPFVAQAPVAPTPAGSAPMQRLTALNNDECEFRIVATIPTPALPGSASITIGVPNSGGNQMTLVLTDQAAGDVIDFTFNPETLSTGPINDSRIASQDFQVSSPWECGTRLGISVQYRDLADNFHSSTWDVSNEFLVTPTRPSAPSTNEFSISATQVEGACNIRVLAKSPNESRPIAIVIREIDSADPTEDNWISGVIIYDPVSDGGIITANLSFASRDAITASVPVLDENKIFTEPRECVGSYLAVIDSPGGTLASTLITLGKVMPTCNSGSVLDTVNALCVEVERGFYTTELNSSRPTACPKGMTTATKASKSINDCYKPLLQTITGFKVPTAVKYGTTFNLPITTNTKALAKSKVTGPCKAKVANVVTKVKGKKVTTKMLKVTASKKAGKCAVTLTSVAQGKYLPMSAALKIKVSKSGK